MRPLIILCFFAICCIHQLISKNANDPSLSERKSRQIVDGVVRNTGVKPKRPGSSYYDSVKLEKVDRTKKILAGLAIAGMTKIATSIKNKGTHKYSPGRYYNDDRNSGNNFGKNPICTNSRIPGEKFKCPLENFNADENLCCGPPGHQWCCNRKEQNKIEGVRASVLSHHGQHRNLGSSILKLLLFIILLPVLLTILLVACACTGMCGLRDDICGLLPCFSSDSNNRGSASSAKYAYEEAAVDEQ